jgi:hypothetical protein
MALALALPVMLFAVPSQAFKRWDAGFRGGVNIAGLYGTDADSVGTDSNPGFTGGVWGTSWLNEGVGIRLEALYTQKGATDDSITANINYIDIPLLVVFRRELTPGKSYIMMEVGPVFSFKTGADINNGNDLDANTTGYDFGGAVGFGLAFEIGFQLDLVANARYSVGFVSISENSDLDYRNYGLAFTAGIQRRFGYW